MLTHLLLLLLTLLATTPQAEKVPAGMAAAADNMLVQNVKNYIVPVIIR